VNANTLNSEGEIVYPQKDIVENAHLKKYDEIYEKSIKDVEGFWRT